MGGGTFGNRTSVGEFNIWADPEAADDRVRVGRPAGDGRPRRDPPVPGDAASASNGCGRSAGGSPRCSPTCSTSSPARISAAPTRARSTAPRCTTRSPCWPSPIPTLFDAGRAPCRDRDRRRAHPRHDRDRRAAPRGTAGAELLRARRCRRRRCVRPRRRRRSPTSPADPSTVGARRCRRLLSLACALP